MAQLIKLDDYVSRYQYDMYRYPSQFSRLKRERWNRLKQEWQASFLHEEQPLDYYVEEKKNSLKDALKSFKKWYRRNKVETFIDDFEEKNYSFKYKSLPEVKMHFLRELYEFQLNWASSTITEKSTMKRKYYFDETLKWFLQSFPDNYFVLYYPVVKYPKAIVQFDILLIGPTDIYCIVHLNGKENTIFQTFSDRYWLQKEANEERKIINPSLSLNRMSSIIKRILFETELEMNVSKVVITNKGYIDVHAPWSGTHFLDQRSLGAWNQKLKNNQTPIKSVQLKVAQNIINVCQTYAEQRDGYEEESSDGKFSEE